MRVNTARSIETANTVHARFGSWKAAKEAARFVEGKFVVHSAVNGCPAPANAEADISSDILTRSGAAAKPV